MTDHVASHAPPDAPGPAGGVLVIGYGNSLRGDDGVGPRVAELAAADPRLAGAVVAAHHQLTPELALDMSAARLVVLVDATTDAAPGVVAVRRLDAGGGADASGAGGDGGASSHHVGPGVLLALARDLYGAAPVTHVVSIGVADLETGEALSPPVAAAVPAALDAVAALVAAQGDGRAR